MSWRESCNIVLGLGILTRDRGATFPIIEPESFERFFHFFWNIHSVRLKTGQT